MTGKLKVGLGAWLGKGARTATQLGNQAAKAESLGFHSFWLPENHFGETNSVPAPLMLLAVAAARTTKLKLGTGCSAIMLKFSLESVNGKEK